jgi:cobalamin biosynthesis protein CbiD
VAAPPVPAWELSKKPSAGAKSVKASSATTTTTTTAAAAAAAAAAASTEGAGSSMHMSVSAAAGAQPRGLVRNNSGAFSASASIVDLSRQADEDDASMLAMEQDVEDADETIGVTEFF